MLHVSIDSWQHVGHFRRIPRSISAGLYSGKPLGSLTGCLSEFVDDYLVIKPCIRSVLIDGQVILQPTRLLFGPGNKAEIVPSHILIVAFFDAPMVSVCLHISC